MKVMVDRTRCNGTGICEITAPAVFEIDDDGALRIITEEVSPDQHEAVKTAIQNCPTQALSIMD
jgi:ferredoxin